jgi:hypothetical protein
MCLNKKNHYALELPNKTILLNDVEESVLVVVLFWLIKQFFVKKNHKTIFLNDVDDKIAKYNEKKNS